MEDESRNRWPRGRAKPVDRGFLQGLLGFRVRQAQFAVFKHFANFLGEWNITPGQIGILALIEANPGLNQAALAKAIGIERSSLGEVIKRLETRGLIRRGPSRSDKRSNTLSLSEAGEAFFADIKPKIAEHERLVSGGLTRDEFETLLRLLSKIAVE